MIKYLIEKCLGLDESKFQSAQFNSEDMLEIIAVAAKFDDIYKCRNPDIEKNRITPYSSGKEFRFL